MTGGPEDGDALPGPRDEDAGSPGSASVRKKDPLIGTTLDGRYLVEALIARGGMGRIYRAKQSALGRTIALKVMDLGYSEELDPDFAKRFVLEASTCAQLSHPNTIRVFDYGTDGDICYIAMELIQGVTLLQAIHDTAPFPAARLLHVARQICSSLSEAHGKGIIHRDLKPSNVLLSQHGEQEDFVKVLDFGLVKLLREDAPEITRSGLFLGSPNYMSPEQIRSSNVDQRSDLYSLGVILFMAITGRAPFKRNSSINVLLAQLEEQPPQITEVAPDTDASAALQWVIMTCLEKEADRRFASVDELNRAFKACQKELRGELGGPLLLRLLEGKTVASTVPAGADPLIAHGLMSAGSGLRSEIPTVETGAMALGHTPSLGSQAWRPSGPSGTFSLGPAVVPDRAPGRAPPRATDLSAPTLEHPGPGPEPTPSAPHGGPSGPSFVGSASEALERSAARAERSAARRAGARERSGILEAGSEARRRKRAPEPSVWQSRGFLVLLVLVAGAATAALLALLARSPGDGRAARTEPSGVPPGELPPEAPAEEPAAAAPVQLTSTPPGAGVYRDGDLLGATPFALPVPAGTRWRVTLIVPGRPEKDVLVAGGSGTLHVDLLAGVAPPPPSASASVAIRPGASAAATPTPAANLPPEATPAPVRESPAATPEPATPKPTTIRVNDVRDPWDD